MKACSFTAILLMTKTLPTSQAIFKPVHEKINPQCMEFSGYMDYSHAIKLKDTID